MQTNLMLKLLNPNCCGFFRCDTAKITKNRRGQAHRHDRGGMARRRHDDGEVTMALQTSNTSKHAQNAMMLLCDGCPCAIMLIHCEFNNLLSRCDPFHYHCCVCDIVFLCGGSTKTCICICVDICVLGCVHRHPLSSDPPAPPCYNESVSSVPPPALPCYTVSVGIQLILVATVFIFQSACIYI